MSADDQSAAAAKPAAASGDRIEPYVWKIAGVVILGMTMSILDTTIVNVAIDTLGRELGSTLAQIQWVATGYLLALAAVIPLTGWAARRFGAKRVYLASIALFTLGSALCGLAESSTTLILFRVLQGVGGGMIMPVAQMIMAEVAGPKRMGRVMGIVVMPAMLAPILGPVVGGLILENLHWSWIFFVNVPIGIVAAILGLRMLPDSDLGEAGKLDWLGLLLLATSMPLVVYGLSDLGEAVDDQHAAGRLRPLRDRDQGKLHRADRDLADRRRPAAHRRLRLARAARRAAAARRAPLRQPDLRLRLTHHLRPRRGALRGDDPGAALLPAGPRRERHRHRPADRAAGTRDAARLPLDRADDRPLRRWPGGDRRRLDPHPQLAAAGLHRRRHLDPLHLGDAADPRRRHRPLVHPGHHGGVRLAAHRPALRRDAADERPAAGRRGDRDGGAGGGPAAGECRGAWSGGAGRGLRHRLLVGARDLCRVDHPGAGPAPRRGTAQGATDARRGERDRDRRGVRGAARCRAASRQEAITEALGVSFRQAFRRLRSLRGRDTHRGDEIGHAQFELLVELHARGPLCAGELAEVVGASAATVSGMLDNLCAAELVERSRSESDRRLVVVKLTRRGKRKVEARKALWRRRWEEALEGVEEEELRVASRVLDRIGDIFTERPED